MIRNFGKGECRRGEEEFGKEKTQTFRRIFEAWIIALCSVPAT